MIYTTYMMPLKGETVTQAICTGFAGCFSSSPSSSDSSDSESNVLSSAVVQDQVEDATTLGR